MWLTWSRGARRRFFMFSREVYLFFLRKGRQLTAATGPRASRIFREYDWDLGPGAIPESQVAVCLPCRPC